MEQLETRVQALDRMASLWGVLGTPVKERWASDAWILVIDYPRQGVAWVDPSFRVRWIVPWRGTRPPRA